MVQTPCILKEQWIWAIILSNLHWLITIFSGLKGYWKTIHHACLDPSFTSCGSWRMVSYLHSQMWQGTEVNSRNQFPDFLGDLMASKYRQAVNSGNQLPDFLGDLMASKYRQAFLWRGWWLLKWNQVGGRTQRQDMVMVMWIKRLILVLKL